MRRPLCGAIVLASILSSEWTGTGQTGVPCYYDWSTAPRQHFMIADSPEYKSIVAACRQQRAETVPWDQHVQTFQTAVDMRALSGDAQRNLVQLVEMLRKERDHLRAASATRPPATRSAPPAGDSSVRYFDLGPMLNQRVTQPDRLIVAPEFRSWVPQFLRERVGNVFRVYGRITHFEGEATIRRGDETVRVSELLQRGSTWVLRPGDVFEVRQGRLVIEYDGRRYDLRPGSRTAIDLELDEQCMTKKTHGNAWIRGAPMYLIEGTLLYMTTTTAVQPACVVTTPDYIGSIRGTAFSITQMPSGDTRTVQVSVTQGHVSIGERTSGRTWTFGPGDRQTFTTSGPPSSAGATQPHHDWTVQNSCTVPVHVNLYELDSQGRRVGWWPRQTIPPGGSQQIRISPTLGQRVCYGGSTEAADLHWGIGLGGERSCKDCCWDTTAAVQTRAVNLTCR